MRKEFPKTTLSDLFAQIGGYMGLLAGVSVITLFEGEFQDQVVLHLERNVDNERVYSLAQKKVST
jgi:hypothetical protein